MTFSNIRFFAASLLLALVLSFGASGCRKALDDAKSVYRGEAGTKSAESVRPRVNAAVQVPAGTIPEGWCEVRYEPGKGPVLELPQVETFSAGRPMDTPLPRWINMWATWCKPCVAEMDHIVRWRNMRLGNTTEISLELLSIDTDLIGFKAFLARHLELRSTKLLRMANPDALPEFASGLGLGQETTVPIHIFTDRESHIVCVRAGGIAESDLGVIRELLK